MACDVTDAESVAGLADGGGRHAERAGQQRRRRLRLGARSPRRTADDWRRMFEVNVIGLMQVTRALLPALIASGDG